MTISILLVDGHVLFRAGVRALLEAITEFCIVGEAGDGLQALALAITAAAGGRFYFSPILRERIVLSELGNPAIRVGVFYDKN